MSLRGRDCASEIGTVRLSTASAGETQAVAAAVAPHLAPGDLVLLSGDLGAGKTTFVQAVAETWGVTEPVTSPTFALAHHYSGKCELRHIDLYRLAEPTEMLDYILDELEEAILLVEWGAPLAEFFPNSYFAVKLDFSASSSSEAGSGSDFRRIEINGVGSRWQEVHQDMKSALKPFASK